MRNAKRARGGAVKIRRKSFRIIYIAGRELNNKQKSAEAQCGGEQEDRVLKVKSVVFSGKAIKCLRYYARAVGVGGGGASFRESCCFAAPRDLLKDKCRRVGSSTKDVQV